MKKEVFLIICILLIISLVNAATVPVDIKKGESFSLNKGDVFAFEFAGNNHKFRINEVKDDSVELLKDNNKITLVSNDVRELDLSKDTFKDVRLQLEEVKEKRAKFTVKLIEKPKPVNEEGVKGPATREPTPQEKQNLQQILTYMPYVTNGLAVVNGHMTFFDAAKGMAISQGMTFLTGKSPEIGGLYQGWNAFKGLEPYLKPSEKGPGAEGNNKVTGQFILDKNNYLAAASDGKDFYYNFRIESLRNEDLSFLFNNGNLFGNNVDIFKDFSDTTFTLTGSKESSLIINEDLFRYLEGSIKIDKDNGKISKANLVSLKDGNELNFEVEHPFRLVISNRGRMDYEFNEISFDKLIGKFKEKNWLLEFGDIKGNINADVYFDAVNVRNNFLSKTSKGNINAEVVFETENFKPAVYLTGDNEFYLSGIKMKPYDKTWLKLEGFKGKFKFDTENERIELFSEDKLRYSNGVNEVNVLTFNEYFNNLKIKEHVKEKLE